MRARILITGDYPTEICRGGVQAVTQATARALAAHDDLDVHVATTSPRFAGSRIRVDQGVTVHEAKVATLPASVRASTVDVAALRSLIDRIRPQLVHAHSQEGHALAALRSGLPAVVSVHGLLQAQNRLLEGSWVARKIRAALWRRVEVEVLGGALDAIVMSRHVADAVRRDSEAKLHWAPNPIDPDWCQLGDDPEPGRLLFVGLITPRKDLATLIRALPLLPERMHLRIAGAVDNAGYLESLRHLARQLGVEGRVVFTGRIDERSLREEYRRADLFVLTSLEDSAPIAITQALAAGTPVVASRVGGIPDLVVEGEVGHLFTAGDSPALASCVTELLGDSQRRLRYSRAARARGAVHAPAAVALRLREIYTEVLARQGIALPLREQRLALAVLRRHRHGPATVPPRGEGAAASVALDSPGAGTVTP